jgi:hypothetical protein
LGLRAPTSEDFRVGFATGAGLIVVLMAFGIILVFLFTPEQLEEQNQASQQLALSFTTLPAALLVSISAAVSEEILFRGALQPVFGLLPTSVFFTLLHVQNLLTPGMVMIFVVSWVFGWVRRRYSTTAAIVAHFVYDFIQLTFLALSVSASVI